MEQRPASIAILDVCRVRFDEQCAPIGVDHRMALAAVDLLVSVIAPRAAGFVALAVDDGGGWAGVTADPLAIGNDDA